MLIFIGLDDTDTPDSPGTNQIAKAIVATLADRYRFEWIARHQLLIDPRVPYTSKNGCASMLVHGRSGDDPQAQLDELFETARDVLRERFVEGSDPGLCVTNQVPPPIVEFWHRCRQEVVEAAEARRLAREASLRLEGLGGTCEGVIGALAAVGAGATGNDGRLVQWRMQPDDLSGLQPVSILNERQVQVTHLESGSPITSGSVDIGKRLRPNLREGGAVLFAAPCEEGPADHRAVKLP